MSEGPIKRWRDGYKVEPVTTRPSVAVHAPSGRIGITYCGRRGTLATSTVRAMVSCSECLAALRADA